MVSVGEKSDSDFAHFPSPHLHLMQTPLWWKVFVDICKIVSKFLQALDSLSSRLNRCNQSFRERETPQSKKHRQSFFDYQCLSLCFGEYFPCWKWSWAESNRRPNK